MRACFRVPIFRLFIVPALLIAGLAGPAAAQTDRVTAGLQTLYTFQEGAGGQVADVSGAAAPLDLTIADPAAVRWIAGGGLALDAPALLLSSAPAAELAAAVAASGELTLEAWIRPADAEPGPPGKILTVSGDRRATNLTLVQGRFREPGEIYKVQLQTTQSDLEGRPHLNSPPGSVLAQLQHVVFTHAADGTVRIYIDAAEVATQVAGGDLTAWDPTYPLAIGDDPEASSPWLGELHLVALYDRALAPAEVTQNFDAGPGADPPPPADEELPAPEIGPQQAPMLEVGESFQFTAQWPAGTPPELVAAPIVWTSSNPDLVGVTAGGLAQALTDDAYAVITAHADVAVPHRPGFGSVTVGAEIHPGVTEIAASLLLGAEPAAEGELALTVARTAETLPIGVGDVVSFGRAVAIEVAAVADQGTTLLLTGPPPALDEVFAELDIHVSPEDSQRIQAVIETAAAGVTPLASPIRQTAAAAEDDGCNIKSILETNVPVFPTFEVEVQEAQLLLFLLNVDGLAELRLNSLEVASELECELDLPSLFLGIIPLPAVGLTIELEQAYTIAGIVGFSIESVASASTPSASVSQSFSGGIEYRGGPLEVGADVASPVTRYEPGGATIDAGPELAVSLSTSAKLEVAVLRATLSIATIIDLAEFDVAVMEAQAGTSLTIPVGGRLFGDPDYANPTMAGFLTGDVIPAKVRTGDGIGALLEFFGASSLEAQTAAFRLIDETLPWPRPQPPSYSIDPVFLAGGDASFPPFTYAHVLTQEGWPSWLPEPVGHYEIWGRLLGSDDDFVLLWESSEPSFLVEPTLDQVGLLETRALMFYSFPPFLGLLPVASGTTPLDIREGGDLFLHDYEELIQTLPVGTQRLVEPLVGNVGEEAIDYELSFGGVAPPGVTVDGGSGALGTVEPSEAVRHEVLFECGEEPSFLETSLTLSRLPAPGETYDYPVRLLCTLLEIEPESLSFQLGVFDGLQTKSIVVRHAAFSGDPVDVQVALPPVLPLFADIVVQPTAVTVSPSGPSESISVQVDCRSIGKETVGLLLVPSVGEIGHLVPVDVHCTDSGGVSWGDPHLETFDGVNYDFQAVGEYVFTRDPIGGFEIQVRQTGSSGVSYNRAAAMRVGANRVAFYTDPPAGGGTVMVDGDPIDIDHGVLFELSGGGTILRDGDRFTVEWPTSEGYATVTDRGSYLSLFVSPGAALAGQLQGLLGDADGSGANDFRLRDGTPLSSPPTFAERYGCPATRCLAYDDPGGWILTGIEESLFDYDPGEGPETFAPPLGQTYPDVDVDLGAYPPEQVAWASAQCTAAGIIEPALLEACVLDIVVSGNVEMGLEAAEIGGGGGGGEPAPEICDGSDNDLDGAVDEDDVCACTEIDRDGRSYAICATPVPWRDARAACLTRGFDLARVADADENAWIRTQTGLELWIGLTDEATDGIWLWTDGGALFWENWGGAEPNGGPNENCGQLRVDGTWNDLPCEWSVPFVCE